MPKGKKKGRKRQQFEVAGHAILRRSEEASPGQDYWPERVQFCLLFQFPGAEVLRSIPVVGVKISRHARAKDWTLPAKGLTKAQIRHRLGQLMQEFPVGSLLWCFSDEQTHRSKGKKSGADFWKLEYKELPEPPTAATREEAAAEVGRAVLPYKLRKAASKANASRPAGRGKILDAVRALQEKHGKTKAGA